MKDRVKKLELKKLIQEYNFLLTDETYKQEVISETKSDFLKEIHNRKVELGLIKDDEESEKDKNETNKQEDLKEKEDLNQKDDSNSKEKEESKENSELNNQKKENSKIEKSPKVKKIYREIVKKTHPDKTNSDKYIDLYNKATDAYNINDITTLFFIASDLDLDFELEEIDIQTINQSIIKKRKELYNIEMSYLWLWYNAKTKEQKNKVVELFISKNKT